MIATAHAFRSQRTGVCSRLRLIPGVCRLRSSGRLPALHEGRVMGAGMCKDIVPGAGVGGVGRGGICPASGGCRDTVDRTMERILHRKTQAVQGSNISSRPNGISMKSSSSPTPFMFSDLPKRPHPGLKGPRTPPAENGNGPLNMEPPVPEKPPVRPPRKKDRLRKPALPLPRRNQSAATLSSQASPEATAADLEVYLKRCHSMGAVPALLEELKNSRHASSVSLLTSSSLESRHEQMQIPMVVPQDRLPSFASMTPPPSPSSISPGDENAYREHAPNFFIGSRNRSPTSSQDAASYVDLWTSGRAKGPLINWEDDGMHDLIRKLRRVRSQGESVTSNYSHRRGDHGVGPLNEHVIDILPTKCAGPPNLSVSRSSSTPQLAQAPIGNTVEDRNNPRTILLKILGQYHCLPGSGGLARKGKKGEEDELRALEKQLHANWGHLKRNSSKADGKDEREDGKKKLRTRDEKMGEDDDNSSSSVTPSLGELEEALADMLEEDDWEEREEERAKRAAKERDREDAEDREMREAEERMRSQERMVREERLKEEGESGVSVMALKMKRENTFTALSDLSKDELLE